MSYAIIGAGNIGRALARRFAESGIEVRVANSRGPASLKALADEFGDGIVPSEIEEALAADVVIMAIPNGSVPAVASQIPDWEDRILVDATNAIDFSDFSPVDLGGRPSTDLIAEAVPTARVVKAFNTLPAAVLEASPRADGGERVLFLSGSAPKARDAIGRLATDLGFAPIDLGRADEGGQLAEFGGPLVLQNLVKQAPRS